MYKRQAKQATGLGAPGNGVLLHDLGFDRQPDETSPADHGEHVHAGENVPAHYTVLYVMRVEEGG